MKARRLRERLLESSPGSTHVCRRCGDLLPTDALDFAKQRAACPACGATNHLRSTAEAIDLGQDDPPMPRGAWRRPDYRGERIGVSCASLSGFLVALGFALFWNGIVGFFSFAAYASVYMHLTGTPAILQGWQISKDLPLEPWMTVFFVLFLLPFQAIGLAMVWAVLMALGGSTEIHVNGAQSCLVHRFGMLAIKTRFDAAQVVHVHLLSTRDSEGHHERAATIEIWFEGLKRPGKRTSKRIGVPSSRRAWLAAAWKKALLPSPDAR